MTWSNGFKPERFALPKNGLDLRDDIDNLKALAEADDPDEGFDGPLDSSSLP